MTIEEPRFLVDTSMLRLGRWLRAAGYDTDFADETDSEYYLLREALNNGRLLVTQNSRLADMRRAQGIVILLSGDTLEECAEELSAHLDIDWEHNPFTRCTACNTKLKSNKSDQYCPNCKHVLWDDGSHLNRMRKKLDNWHRRYSR